MQNPLATLTAAATITKGPPPVELWNPPFCGDIDMRIARDGTWFYGGTPIGRPALVKLFASILRKDPEGFRLVTPVEKVGIIVEDAPFLGVEMKIEHGSNLSFRTNVDDWVEAGAAHPLRFEPGPAGGVKPYVHVRGGLWALLKRALTYDLIARGEVAGADTGGQFGVHSGGLFFPICSVLDVEGQS